MDREKKCLSRDIGMTFKTKNFSKAGFKAQITRKQSQFNRFKRRFAASKNPVEKSFLKSEAAQIVNDLKACSKMWKSFGFGACTWITRNFTTAGFKSATKTSMTSRRKNTRKYGKKSYAKKSYAKRSYAKRSNKSRTSARRSTKSRANARRSSYVAW